MNGNLFKIAICDDNIRTCSEIETYILEYCDISKELSMIEIYYSGETLYKDLEKGIIYDLLFLDIELGGEVSGIQIGQYIRCSLKNEAMQIIYISSYKNYALELFKIRPMDFLIKPITNKDVYQAVKTGISLAGKHAVFFQYKQGRTWKKVYVKDILYFRGKDREVEMLTIADKITFYDTLQNIYGQLGQYRFFYAHKSYLINYIHVKEFFYDKLVMSNGESIKIAQPRRKSVREIQKEFINKGD